VELTRRFEKIRFSDETLQRAASTLRSISECKNDGKFQVLEIHSENDSWKYDEIEGFLADLPKAEAAHLYYSMQGKDNYHHSLQYRAFGPDEGSTVTINCATREEITAVVRVFDGSL
jgi:hypothetical protein